MAITADDDLILLNALPSDLAPLAERVMHQVVRSTFDLPGFVLISFVNDVESTALRGFMVALKESLADLFQTRFGTQLEYQSLGRFNQQGTTKFHLDGAPDESYLMLGYEPTAIESQFRVADYSRAAADWGMTPRALLAERNPMQAGHELALLPYVTQVNAFDHRRSQVVLLNNSCLASGSLGVLHQASVPNPLGGVDRVVNSTMMAVAPSRIFSQDQQNFLDTSEIAGASGP